MKFRPSANNSHLYIFSSEIYVHEGYWLYIIVTFQKSNFESFAYIYSLLFYFILLKLDLISCFCDFVHSQNLTPIYSTLIFSLILLLYLNLPIFFTEKYEPFLTRRVSLDCEMVGTGPKGHTYVLGRVCVVNELGHVILNKFVKPVEKVRFVLPL